MRYVSIDMEFCGLDSEKHDVLEFGAVIDDTNSPTVSLDKLPTFHCYFVQDAYTGSPYALSMHPHIFERIADRVPPYNYYSPMKFANKFKQFLWNNGYEEEFQKAHIIIAGKNFGNSDLNFLKNKTDFSKHISWDVRILDPGFPLWDPEDNALPGLIDCKRKSGLTNLKVTHNAVDDAKDVVECIRYIVKEKHKHKALNI